MHPRDLAHVRVVTLFDRARPMTIEVTDRGAGLPEGAAPIFDSGVSLKPGHAGIGLSLVRDAARAAMGAVEASQADETTTFTVSIPA